MVSAIAATKLYDSLSRIVMEKDLDRAKELLAYGRFVKSDK